jgi:hypothetical protein
MQMPTKKHKQANHFSAPTHLLPLTRHMRTFSNAPDPIIRTALPSLLRRYGGRRSLYWGGVRQRSLHGNRLHWRLNRWRRLRRDRLYWSSFGSNFGSNLLRGNVIKVE